MQQADLFLSNEIIKESSLAMKRRKIDVQITGCVRRDDVHYATLLPNPQLAYFEEVTWVELRSDGYSQYGSLWLADEKNPYLILAQPISAGLIQLVEADGKKLLEMQRHALSTLKAKSTAHTKRLMDIITGQNQKKPDCEY
jgi:hypothetical protein